MVLCLLALFLLGSILAYVHANRLYLVTRRRPSVAANPCSISSVASEIVPALDPFEYRERPLLTLLVSPIPKSEFDREYGIAPCVVSISTSQS